MLNSTSNRARVYKQRQFGVCPTCHPGTHFVPHKPWIGRHPYLGSKNFDTWREAYDYARTPLILMNELN